MVNRTPTCTLPLVLLMTINLTFLDLFILVLATVSLADVLSNEVIGMPIRKLAGIQHNAKKQAAVNPGNFFSDLLWCEYCLMYWSAGLWMVLFAVYYPAFLYIGGIFAVAKTAHFVWERFSKFSPYR